VVLVPPPLWTQQQLQAWPCPLMMTWMRMRTRRMKRRRRQPRRRA
jgi:hypothetical protein